MTAQPMSETALYYFFSTIAQSFATAIALLGALALYRLQILHGELQTLTNYLIQFVKSSDEIIKIESARSLARYEEVIELFKASQGGHTNQSVERMAGVNQQDRKLRRTLAIALALTLCVLLGSIVVIPFVPTLHNPGRVFAMGLTMGLIVVSLVFYIRLASQVLSFNQAAKP
jgi:hypothetical protein